MKCHILHYYLCGCTQVLHLQEANVLSGHTWLANKVLYHAKKSHKVFRVLGVVPCSPSMFLKVYILRLLKLTQFLYCSGFEEINSFSVQGMKQCSAL